MKAVLKQMKRDIDAEAKLIKSAYIKVTVDGVPKINKISSTSYAFIFAAISSSIMYERKGCIATPEKSETIFEHVMFPSVSITMIKHFDIRAED